MEDKVRVLLIEESERDQKFIKETFSHIQGDIFQLYCCFSLAEGIKAVPENNINIIFLGTTLVDTKGLPNLKRLVETFPKIPTILLLDLEDDEYGKNAMQIGAQDYVAKWSLNRRLLHRIIIHGIERQSFQTELESYRQMRITAMEKNYMNLIENNIDGMMVIDKNKKVEFVNLAAEKMLGRNKDELLGKPCEVPFEQNSTKELMIKYPDKPNSILETQTISTKWADREANLLILRDITQRKRSEQHISFEKTLLEYQSEASIDGILYVSEEGTINSYNSRLLKMWELKPEDIKSKSGNEVLMLIATKIRNGDFLKSKVTYICDHQDEIAHGEVYLFNGGIYDVYSAPVKSNDGTYYGRVWSFYDITKRINTEEALRKSEERFRTIFENVPVGLFRTTPEGKIIMANPALVNMLGYNSVEELNNIDLNKEGFAPGFTRQDFRNILEKEGEVMGLEYKWEGPNNKTFYAKENAKVIKDEAGNTLFYEGSIEDITDKKQAEAKLTEYTLELKRSNQELQDFASITSHDLKEPLRKITTFCDRLKESANQLDEQGTLYLDRMSESAKRLQRLIDDILQYSRITSEPKRFQEVDLNKVLKDILSDLELKIEQSNASIHVNELPTINAEPVQMHQLFLNIISNSLKFSQKDTSPTIVINCNKLDNASYEISIQDNGIGFEEKYLEKIFKPFQRLHTRTQYEGSGIGLAICQKIITRHNGAITATSKIREGSTFNITLPANQLISTAVNQEVVV
ncbi:MAG: PAS domain S-box protein [Bacteroidia bacterium]|nr:PAS domain S-box protein [Bacteroidia bacterium]